MSKTKHKLSYYIFQPMREEDLKKRIKWRGNLRIKQMMMTTIWKMMTVSNVHHILLFEWLLDKTWKIPTTTRLSICFDRLFGIGNETVREDYWKCKSIFEIRVGHFIPKHIYTRSSKELCNRYEIWHCGLNCPDWVIRDEWYHFTWSGNVNNGNPQWLQR